ncbi:hypothetical protein [Actinosynnema pretiosum]|uniref:Uncharacterized protein n=1 Tax=Actinosynnema pretiosum TaxID=42197 RepID=A0A290Z8Q5_9PSEU|nr:hypothetical protein [Actinosynnema pretiosum]ATE55397.1 hypothetical protein CNX65_20665 [Actinosynnema pretiosum]
MGAGAGCTGGGFGGVADLGGAVDREAVLTAVRAAKPDAAEQALRNFTAQLWALRSRMAEGDLVVVPLKNSGQHLAIGEVAGGYRCSVEQPDVERRHVRPVRWLVADLPRTVVKQDLLCSFGAFSTVEEVPDEAADSAQHDVDIARYALDRIASRTIEEFAGHRLADLVAAGLLVAWGGITKQAEQYLSTQRFTIEVWDSELLLGGCSRTTRRCHRNCARNCRCGRCGRWWRRTGEGVRGGAARAPAIDARAASPGPRVRRAACRSRCRR